MQATQTIGIDLPLKGLVWQDADEAVWIGFNEPSWIANRHSLALDSVPTVHTMHEGLSRNQP